MPEQSILPTDQILKILAELKDEIRALREENRELKEQQREILNLIKKL